MNTTLSGKAELWSVLTLSPPGDVCKDLKLVWRYGFLETERDFLQPAGLFKQPLRLSILPPLVYLFLSYLYSTLILYTFSRLKDETSS
ncbi:MAG: hypothetical protein RMX59_034425 [Nostoc sp. DedSLP05]|nr:hypothetical protein [Nostoc sp. DedSLP05]MDZ8102109.1 hypothetical protein [Nostoc sp. DedSLP01]